MKHQVIIPQFLRNESIRNYIPHTVKIQKGDTIRWSNTDSESHHLFFIKIDPDPANIEVLDERLYLNSGELGEIVFNYNYERIDYLCKIHRREVNSITIFTEDYKNMSFADKDQIIISKELNNELGRLPNNTFRTKKIKIPEDKKLKTYEHVKYVYELIGKNKQVLD